jgi:RNA recognition motif-containing protein
LGTISTGRSGRERALAKGSNHWQPSRVREFVLSIKTFCFRFGFVEFMGEEDADYAIKVMNMIKLYGKPIRVNKVRASM